MSQDYSERIIEFVSQRGYRPRQVRALARAMGIGKAEHAQFREAVKALSKSGRIVLGSKNAVTLPEVSGQVVGSYRSNPRGFGFVVPASPSAHGDLYIPPGQGGDAITGDTVVARVVRRGRRGGRMIMQGRVVEVLERGQSRFVGELLCERGRWFVWPDGKALQVPILVEQAQGEAAGQGEQVVVEIVQYPSGARPGRGVIVERLGRRGEHQADLLSVIRQFHLPDRFAAAAVAEAQHVVQDFDLSAELRRREDRRDRVVITIDPADAKDFDDAIELSVTEEGGYELGVHIADVSYFVRAGGALDEQARLRGNSVYFPSYVIPMLPEVLSNGLCSLQQGQDRLTKSVFIRYDAEGRVVGSRFANTVIRSAARLTYEQVDEILCGRDGGCGAEVAELLRQMERLARAIQQRRLAEGMIMLEVPEVELVLDEEGRVVDAVPAEAGFSHTIIEMFMVEANEAVARLLSGLEVPFLRRIHPEPEALASESLARFLRALGQRTGRRMNRQDVQRVLASVRGRPECYAVNLAVLRSMAQAEYSPQNVGHYALASEQYCHFTSPIRRYPDLTVHRLLEMYLRGELDGRGRRGVEADYEQLAELGKHCSYTERRAEAAEQELRLVKILQLLSERVGQVMEAVVTGVTNFGLFVQCRRFLVEGLIRFADLPDDWWEVDERSGCLRGQRTGVRIQIGQVMKVKIERVDVAARQLDLVPAEKLAESARVSKARGARRGGKARARAGRAMR